MEAHQTPGGMADWNPIPASYKAYTTQLDYFTNPPKRKDRERTHPTD